MSQPSVPRSLWSSRFAFIMVTAGAAVGLGNIWKFPYMAGNNGGGAFVLAYLLFILLIGIPAMIAELLIGRRGRQNPVNTMALLAQEAQASPLWQGLGWLGAVTLIMVLSFYSVVAGWSLAYLCFAMQGVFNHATPDFIVNLWSQLLASAPLLILWHTLFMLLTMLVVAYGVNAGIERASRYLMPGLFVILIALVIYACSIGEAKTAVNFLFALRLSDLGPRAIIDALGQAFFSLATGAGCILIYGSYLAKNTPIFGTVLLIAGLDVLVAILSGLAIFPLVFLHGLAPESGPGLMFHALPLAFSHMPGANFIACLFFSLLLFAAWTSSISMAEPLVALLTERRKFSRCKASIVVGILAWLLGLASVFSFNIWSEIKCFGHWGIFQLLTDVSTNILLPIGALLFCIFAGWVMHSTALQSEFVGASRGLYNAWRLLVRYLAPLGILLILYASFL